MSIPVSTVVDVNISIGAPFPSRRGFGILNIVTNEEGFINLPERIRSYSDINEVAGDWPTSSEAYKSANTFFSQRPRPTELKISVRYENGASGTNRGGVLGDELPTFQAITDGTFNITIDGDSQDIGDGTTSLDFSGATSLDDVASIIQSALQAVGTGGYTTATCTFGTGTDNKFLITSGTNGASSTVDFLESVDPSSGTDISDLLRMTQEEDAVLSVGLESETITDSLQAIEDQDADWYMLTFTKEVRDSSLVNGSPGVEDAADWVEARVKVFGNTTNNIATLNSAVTSDIASTLQSKSLRRTMTTYSSSSDEYPSSSIMGRAATVDFSQPDSTITLKFKQMPTITVENISSSQKSSIDNKNANVFLIVGSSDMFAESFMADGVFFDEVHGVDWLTDAIQNNVFGYLLTQPNKVPYTDKGVAGLEQQVIRALDQAVNNGLVAPGETQDGIFLANGYITVTVPVDDVAQSEKDAREYNGLSFTALGAGAIHKVQINGVFER